MLPRRPIVTAIAIHPAGHFFAVGYTDGTVAFWALEDEDKPLLVRTLDEVDLHLVDAGKLEEFFASQDQSSESSKPPPTVPREPVFKLTWSGFPNSEDPRGGPTVLTILGGLRADESPGVTAIQLPAFNPPEAPLPTSPASEVALHPSYRTAMRESLSPSNAYTYYTKGVAEDYLLIPRDSPHFSGSWDPIAILLLSDSGGGTRAIEAYQFPPPSFVINEPTLPASPPIKPKNAEEDEIDDVVSQELTSTIEAMKLDEDPKQIMLPYALWNGANGVRSADILSLPRDAYESLTNERATAGDSLILQGGVAWVEDHENEMRLLKVCSGPPRLIDSKD